MSDKTKQRYGFLRLVLRLAKALLGLVLLILEILRRLREL